MTQQAIAGQPQGDPAVTDPAQAGGQSITDGGAQQATATPAPGDGGSAATVPLAVYTQTAQRSAAIAKALGISKDASPAEFTAALEARLAERRQVPGDDDELDPVLAARMRQQDEREWAGARREFGDAITDAAQAFADTLATNRSPYDLVAAMATALTDIMAAQSGASPAPAGGTQQPSGGQQAGVATPDLGDLPRGGGPSGVPDPSDFRGDTDGWFRRLLGGQAAR